MLEMLACIMMLIFIAVGAYLTYCQITSSEPHDLSFPQLNPLNLWRFIVCGFIFSVVALLIVHFNFSDTAWRDQVRLGVGIGLLPGLLAGGIWQLIIHEALSSYLRRYVLIAIAFSSALFLYIFGSGMFSELNQEQLKIEQMKLIHSLANRDIRQVDIKYKSSESISVRDIEYIKSLKAFFADAKPFYSIQEDGLKNFKIEIHTDVGDIGYDAFVPSTYQDDIALQTKVGKYNIVFRLPGLKHWLDENILKKKK